METTFFNLTNCLILSFILFGIGTFGVITKRNILIILMSLEIMLNAVNLSFLSFNYFIPEYRDNATGQYFVMLTIAVAAAEAAIGLALLVIVYRKKKTTDTNKIEIMKG